MMVVMIKDKDTCHYPARAIFFQALPRIPSLRFICFNLKNTRWMGQHIHFMASIINP
jgi:hypothetical protein